MGTDFISTTLDILFLCSRVREHLIITEFRSYFKQRVLNSQCGNRLWLEFLVDFDWNYVTLCASINFIRNWKSVGGKSNWPNRDLVSHFIYIIRVFDDNCFYNILKIGRLLAASLGLLDFEYLFFFWFRGEQTLKWFFPLQCKHNLPYAGNYALGRQPLQNFNFLIMSFDFSLGAWWWALRFLIIFGGRQLIGSGGSSRHIFEFPQQHVQH